MRSGIGSGPCSTIAVELPPEQRTRHVEQRCAKRAQRGSGGYGRLLAAHDDEEGVLSHDSLAVIRSRLAPVTPAQLPDLTGRVLARRYELTRVLQRGGAGVVYAGDDRTDGSQVAVKVLPPSLRGEWRSSRSEAAALRMLRVAGVVRLLDDGRVDGQPGFEYLVTEFVDGLPFPGRPTPCAWDDIAKTVRALMETLDRIHWAGVLHRDLKPGNVLVREDGTPVVLDLGISQHQRRSAMAYGPTVGTPRYLAPEQLTRGEASIRSDLYALGVMLHEALAGEPPRQDGAEQVSLAKLAPDAPKTIAALVDQLCSRDPEDRPASAVEALQAIAGESTEPRHAAIDTSSIDALRTLFAGHDRVLHIPEDAARELANRTDGTTADVLEELDAWERAGLGRWADGKFHIDRRGVEALRAGLRVSPPRIEAIDDTQALLEDGDTLLLIAIVLAGAEARTPLLAATLDQSEAHTVLRATALTELGYLTESEGGYLRVRKLPSAARAILVEQSRGLHRRLARSLPIGSEARVHQFAAANEMERVPSEAVEAARALQQAGALPRARLLLTEALKALEDHPDADAEGPLTEMATMAAAQSGSPAACDHLLFQLAARPPSPRIERLEAITRSACHGYAGEYERGLDTLPPLSESPSLLERRICGSLKMFLGRGVSPEVLEAHIEELEMVAQEEGNETIGMIAAGGRAWLHYRRERFEQAAEMHLMAAELADSAATRASLRLNAASALLEAGAFEQAMELAEGPRALANRVRMAAHEARAEWIIRSARYRLDDQGLSPDSALVHASQELGQRHQTGMIALTEGAIAWRQGSHATAIELAGVAASEWTAIRHATPSLLARALVHAAGATLKPNQAEEIISELREAKPATTAIQTAGLIAFGAPALAADCRALIEGCMPSAHTVAPEMRLEVISISEAMTYAQLTP